MNFSVMTHAPSTNTVRPLAPLFAGRGSG